MEVKLSSDSIVYVLNTWLAWVSTDFNKIYSSCQPMFIYGRPLSLAINNLFTRNVALVPHLYTPPWPLDTLVFLINWNLIQVILEACITNGQHEMNTFCLTHHLIWHLYPSCTLAWQAYITDARNFITISNLVNNSWCINWIPECR